MRKIIPILIICTLIISAFGASAVPIFSNNNLDKWKEIETKCTFFSDELDQSQLEMDFFGPVGVIFLAPTINYITAQSFIPTKNILTRVEILAGKNSTATYDFKLAIKDNLLGPDLTALSRPAGDFVIENFSWLEFDFDDILVTPGTTYYIVCSTYDAPDNWYAWGAKLTDVYPYGTVWWSEDDGVTFEEDPDADLTFKTYGYDNQPPSAPTIDGLNNGKPGVEYDFVFNSIDPDGDDVRFIIGWDDGDNETTSFVSSGTDLTASHIWTTKGTYTISVKAEDEFGAESNLTTLEINIPRDKALLIQQYPILIWLFERFPILKHLIRY